MLRIKSFALLLCAVVAPLFIGCESEQTTPAETPVMVIDTDLLEVDGGGGNIPIFYGVKNARPGVRPEVKSNVEWVTVGEITSNTIILCVEASDINEERMCIVTLSYKGMEKPLKVSVVQDKQFLDKFRFEVSDVTHNSCTVKYIPKSSGGYYMANIIDAEYFRKSGISDMEEFINMEMSNYLALAAQHDMTLEFLLKEAVSPTLLFTEEATRSFTGMQSGATYVAYAYGLELADNEYTVTIPLHQVSIEIPMSQFYDVSFKISPQVSNGGMATIAVEPVGWNGYYVINLIPESSLYYVPRGERMTEYTLRAMGSDFYNRARQAIRGGMSVDAFLKSSCYIGSRSITTPIDSDTEYMVAVYAVESIDGEIPVMCSVTSIAYL